MGFYIQQSSVDYMYVAENVITLAINFYLYLSYILYVNLLYKLGSIAANGTRQCVPVAPIRLLAQVFQLTIRL